MVYLLPEAVGMRLTTVSGVLCGRLAVWCKQLTGRAVSCVPCAVQFDFRNGNIRKKFDSLKYTLKKMETTLYEQSLTDNLGFQREPEPVDAQPDAGDGEQHEA